jgi:hypothetical protein
MSIFAVLDRPSVRASPAPVVAEVQPYDLAMYEGIALDGVAARAAGFFSGLEAPFRMLARTEPFSAAPALDHISTLLGAVPPDRNWQRSGLAAYRTFLEELVQRARMRRTRYFLVAWPGSDLPPAALLHAAESSFLTPLQPLLSGLPPFYPTHVPYREEWDHLAPQEPGAPYLAVWSAWELLGTWDLTSFHRLLALPFPLALCVHIETPDLDRTRLKLQNAHNALQAQLTTTGKFTTKDAKSEAAFRDVERAMHITEHGERFHLVTVAVLVQGPTLAKVREYGVRVKNELAARCRLRLEVGEQQEALKLFTTTPFKGIRLDLRAAPALSGGVGVMMPFGFRSRAETAGILWGIDRTTGNPIFYDGWARTGAAGNRPFHLTMLGRPGAGKTFAINVLLHRMALTGTQVILIEPQGHCRRLAESLGAGGSYNPIDFGEASINLLDRVEETLAAQITHVNRQLALLLSSGTDAASRGSDLGRRVFTNLELADLTSAQRRLYAPFWDDPTPLTFAATPRLEDLCTYLADTGRGQALADEIAQLYVHSELGPIFNQPTNLDLSLEARAVCFDVKHVDESYRPWFYAQILAALARHIRNPRRGYPVVLMVDEFKYLAADPVLAKLVVDLNKTARTFGAAIWTADQNPSSYAANEHTQQIIANTPLVLIGKQQAGDVDLDRALFPRLTAVHLTQITTAEPGDFVAIFDNEYYPLSLIASPYELAYFEGT